MEENYEIENNFLEESNTIYRKLKKRTIFVIVLYVITFVSTLFRKYQDFDVIFTSTFFRALMLVSIIMTIINIIMYFLKPRFNEEKIYNFLKKEKEIYELISVIPIFVAVLVFLNAFVISPASVEGPSMEPNYHENDTILISHFDNYDRFDVVIIKVEEADSYSYYIKRIIGLPGETIIIENNHIYLETDGVRTEIEDPTILPENAFTACGQGSSADISESCTFEIPDDSYFVLGDNRKQSNDSRGDLSFVHIDELYGKVILKIDIFN